MIAVLTCLTGGLLQLWLCNFNIDMHVVGIITFHFLVQQDVRTSVQELLCLNIVQTYCEMAILKCLQPGKVAVVRLWSAKGKSWQEISLQLSQEKEENAAC